MMHTPPVQQYREVLDGLPKISIIKSGEKYEKYAKLGKVLYAIFTSDTWKEWDSIYPILREYHKTGYSEEALPEWITTSYDPRTTPRESTYLIESLSAFGVHHIEQYQAKVDSLTYKDSKLLIGGWLNACETGRHTFWNFKVFLGKGVPEPTDLDVKVIKQITQSSAMLDILTFNRFSPQNYTFDDNGVLIHSYEGHSPEYTPTQRVGCMAARKFPGINPDRTLFDELFTRICQIYGYTSIQSLQQSVSNSTTQLCPYHQATSPSSPPPSATSKT